MTWDELDVQAMRDMIDRLDSEGRMPTVPPFWSRRSARARWDGEREHAPARRRGRVRLAYHPDERVGQLRIRYRRPPGWIEPNGKDWHCSRAVDGGGPGCELCDAVPLAIPRLTPAPKVSRVG